MVTSTPRKHHCEPWQLHQKQTVEAQAALHPDKRQASTLPTGNIQFVSDHRPYKEVKYQQTCTLRVVLYSGSNCPDGFISRGTL